MPRSVSVIYCDDVRYEIRNKLSFIGIYRGKLLVPNFPTVLSKLMVVVQVTTPVEQPFESLRIRILKDDETLGEAKIEEDALSKLKSEAAKMKDQEGTTIDYQCHFMFSPLSLDKPTRIRVRAYGDNEELKGPALIVEKSEQTQDSSST